MGRDEIVLGPCNGLHLYSIILFMYIIVPCIYEVNLEPYFSDLG